VLEEGEDCDGSDLGGAACPSGSPIGAILCSPDCTFIRDCKSPTTTTTLPPLNVGEICGNCIDDDRDGLVDFEDPECCGTTQQFAMQQVKSHMRPRGSKTNFQIHSTLADAGLGTQVNPMRNGQNVYVQLSTATGDQVLCAWVPAKKFMTMKKTYMFWDRKGRVKSAQGLSDMTLIRGRNGRLKLRTHGPRVNMKTPSETSLKITVAFFNPTAGNTASRCSRTTQSFRVANKGLRTP
jgi:hypothetical protein